MRLHLLPALLAICILGPGAGRLTAGPPAALPSTVVVFLPADASLTVDDRATTSTSASRRLITPPLQAGKVFHYTLKAELARDGKVITVKKVIVVRAGQETVVSLHLPHEDDRGDASSVAGPNPNRSVRPGRGDAPPAFPREYSITYSTSDSPRFQVAPMNEQDPMIGFGPPGFREFSK